MILVPYPMYAALISLGVIAVTRNTNMAGTSHPPPCPTVPPTGTQIHPPSTAVLVTSCLLIIFTISHDIFILSSSLNSPFCRFKYTQSGFTLIDTAFRPPRPFWKNARTTTSSPSNTLSSSSILTDIITVLVIQNLSLLPCLSVTYKHTSSCCLTLPHTLCLHTNPPSLQSHPV